MNAADLEAILVGLAADYVKQLALRVDEVSTGRVVLSMPMAPSLVHSDGVLCGQAIMAAADTAMLMAMIAQLGEFRPMTTVQLQTSFVRPVPNSVESVRIVATVLRHGKSLSYGEVAFSTPDGKLAAHATTTYALI